MKVAGPGPCGSNLRVRDRQLFSCIQRALMVQVPSFGTVTRDGQSNIISFQPGAYPTRPGAVLPRAPGSGCCFHTTPRLLSITSGAFPDYWVRAVHKGTALETSYCKVLR
jgi:hypothetical protein